MSDTDMDTPRAALSVDNDGRPGDGQNGFHGATDIAPKMYHILLKRYES